MNIFSAMSIIESLYFKILIIDTQNDTFQEIKLEKDDIPSSTKFSQWWNDFADGGRVHPDDVRKYKDFIKDMHDDSVTYYRRKDSEGAWHWAYVELFPYEGSKYLMFIRFNTTVSQRLAAMDTLEYENYHDSLTHCRNRRAYDIAINNIKKVSYILYIDLDDLKKYNDSAGHVAGDRYIVACTKCMRECFRDEDIYRYGGDEFIIITQCNKERFAGALSKLKYEMKQAGVRASLGYSLYDTSTTLLEKVREAEIMMYENKKKYKINK